MVSNINLIKENVDYIKNLLLQTQNDIKCMNDQLSEYTNKAKINQSNAQTNDNKVDNNYSKNNYNKIK